MIDLKTDDQIKVMERSGKILHQILLRLLSEAKPGVSLRQIDKLAGILIKESGVKPSFPMVPGYKWNICACVNDVVVHGIPDDYILKNGDILGIDCGVYYGGFHTDHAWTVKIENRKLKKENRDDDIDRFLQTGEETLKKAIQKVKHGNYIYDISKTIQDTIEAAGYNIVRSLVGHGIGRNLHEEPEIPGFVKGRRENTQKMKVGMVLAIEVIYNLGSSDVIYKEDDGWTIAAKDGKISGLFEATVAITSHGALVLT